jgi:uncharacterized protein YxjI
VVKRFGVRQPQLPLLYATDIARTYESGGCGHRTPNVAMFDVQLENHCVPKIRNAVRGPMRYVMKSKLFTVADDFYIRDAAGQDVFFVDGKVLAVSDQLSFRSLDGEELAFIRQKILSWGPRYEIYRNGVLAALVKKELFSLFHCTFTVDVPGPDDLEAKGNFTEHEYVFARGDRTVATVSKKWFSWVDTYGVDVADDEDHILILAATVVIALCHARKH